MSGAPVYSARHAVPRDTRGHDLAPLLAGLAYLGVTVLWLVLRIGGQA